MLKNPHETIGDPPYMLRWVIFKPSPFRRVAKMVEEEGRKVLRFLEVAKKKTYLPSIYLHLFKRSDDDRHFHDHVGWSISIILRGGYWELTPDIDLISRLMYPEMVATAERRWRWRGPGSITFRRATDPHIIALGMNVTRDRNDKVVMRVPTREALHTTPIWSLWIRGPWRREWGFYTENGWVRWQDYHALGSYDGYKSKAPA